MLRGSRTFAWVVLAMLGLALVGCGPSKKPKKAKKKPYIPTQAELAAHLEKLRNTDTNMVEIPAGRYKLGDNSFKGNRERFFDLEAPFKMDKYEVSNIDWFMYLWLTKGTDNPQYLASTPVVMGDFDTDKWIQDDKNFQFDYENRSKHPVRAIGYDEALGFAKFFKKQLPTAEQWECAARGKEGLRYPWGNRYTTADWKTKCWTSFMMSRGDDGSGPADRESIEWLDDTVPVDSMPEGASPFGVFHMADNVAEWTTSTVPTGKGEFKKLKKSERPRAQVVKGGHFRSRQKGALAAQFFDLMKETATDSLQTGFRCIR